MKFIKQKETVEKQPLFVTIELLCATT